MKTRKPNVLVINVDQLRAVALGCYGNSFIRTPHIDKMASESVVFEHAVSNNPVCVPARSILLSGQYSRTCVGDLGNVSRNLRGIGAVVAAWIENPNRQSRGIVVGYPDELRLRPTDRETLKRIAEVSGGGFEPTTPQLLEPDDRKARQGVPLWPYLLMAALGLFIADVGLRRIEFRS